MVKDMLTISSEQFERLIGSGFFKILKFPSWDIIQGEVKSMYGTIFQYEKYPKITVLKKILKTDTAYCVKCHKKITPTNAKVTDVVVGGKGTRKALTGTCPTCGTKVFKFVKG